MGYRSEVSIIVGKNVNNEIETLVKKCEKMVANGEIKDYDLDNLKGFLSNKTVSVDGNYIRYHQEWIKWYTGCGDDGYQCLTMLETLVKDKAREFENIDVGDVCSFARIGEDPTDNEFEDNNGGMQYLALKTEYEFVKPPSDK